MQLKNSSTRYGAIGMTLHWVIVALVITQFVFASLAEAAEAEKAAHPAAALVQFQWLARHKSVGVTIFALAVARLLWRAFSPPPALPAAMPRWQVVAAKLSHYGFYALLFAMPLSGLVMSAAANYPVSYFGWFTLPNLVGPDEGLRGSMEELHHLLAFSLFVLASVHVAAALKHHFFDKDDVLRRMLPGVSR